MRVNEFKNALMRKDSRKMFILMRQKRSDCFKAIGPLLLAMYRHWDLKQFAIWQIGTYVLFIFL